MGQPTAPDQIKRCSLRTRLLRTLLIPLGISILAVGGFALYVAVNEVQHIDDALLISQAKVIRALMDHEVHEDEPDELHLVINGTTFTRRYEKALAYRVWFHDRLILRSLNTDAFPPSPGDEGFSIRTVAGAPWRFYTETDPILSVITEVSEPLSLRARQAVKVVGALFGPQALLIPIIFLLVSFGIRIGLEPIRKLSAQIATRSAEDLAPIAGDVIPLEVSPFVDAVNALMARLAIVIRQERSFTDNAAHELRTPLAAIKTQAQVAAMAEDPEERAALLRDLAAGVDRASHVVDQVLGLARLDEQRVRGHSFDLSAAAEDVAGQFAAPAARAGLTLKAAVVPGIRIDGDRDAAVLMMRNLIENAVKYTPSAGRVDVRLDAGSDGARFEVADTGPGIPDTDKLMAFERFVRLGRTERPGAGLGLAIAKRAAELHGGTITLADPPQGSGLVVTALLPRHHRATAP